MLTILGVAFSYRFDIFDIGSMDQPNIQKVAVKGQEGDFTSYAQNTAA